MVFVLQYDYFFLCLLSNVSFFSDFENVLKTVSGIEIVYSFVRICFSTKFSTKTFFAD